MEQHYPMTPVETALKERYLSRPDIRGRVLTAQELAEYVHWLMTTVPDDRPLGLTADPLMVGQQNLDEIERQRNIGKRQFATLKSLSSADGFQHEEPYLMPGLDISVSRLIRYMPPHWVKTDYFEIYHCRGGSIPVHFRDETVTLKQGTVLIVGPDVLHASPCCSDDAEVYYYMVRSSTFSEVFWDHIPKNSLMRSFFAQALDRKNATSYLQFETESDIGVDRLFRTIDREYLDALPYKTQMLNTFMSLLFLQLLRAFEGTVRLPRTDGFYWKHQYSAIFSYIQTHYRTETLQEIAQHLGYSERQLTRIVISCTGNNYAALTLRLRMEEAADLLRTRDYSLAYIAEYCGYSEQSSFQRSFRKYFGMTPKAYREGQADGDRSGRKAGLAGQ